MGAALALADLAYSVGAVAWMILFGLFSLGVFRVYWVCREFLEEWLDIGFYGTEAQGIPFTAVPFYETRSGPSEANRGIVAVIVVVWFLLCLDRAGSMICGLLSHPPRLMLELPFVQGPAVFPLTNQPHIWIGILLVILLGLCHPAGASGAHASDGAISILDETARLESMCVAGRAPEDDGDRTDYAILQVVIAVALWEALKRMWCRSSSRFRAVEIQTDGMSLPLPLDEGVPNRARILYCLWRAGYSTDIEAYPLDVQEEYFGYLGLYLRRQQGDEELSD